MNKYLNKHLKIKDKNLKYDFLPSMLEIIERPANKLSNIILFLIAALVITAIVWAKYSIIDITVSAYGVTGPDDGVVTLESQYGGTVSEIYVKDNQWVEAGTVILSIDSTEAELNVEKCQYDLDMLTVQREIYNKVYEGNTKAIDSSSYGDFAMLAEAILQENTLFGKQLEAYEDETEKENLRLEHQLSILQNINTLDVEIRNARTDLEAAKSTLDKMTVKAPTSGTIVQMAVVTKGILLPAGEKVAYLLPDGKENIFTAYVSDEEIEQIRVGDTVNVKIGAYDNTQYEYIEGTVESIGEIALNIDGIGVAYQADIKVPDLPDDIRMGLEGSCEIIIGTRSVLDYFLEPFIEGFSSSLKEV